MLLCIVLGLVLSLTLDTLFLCHDPVVAGEKTKHINFCIARVHI